LSGANLYSVKKSDRQRLIDVASITLPRSPASLSSGADHQYPFKVPGKPLTEADYRKAAQDGGFTGNIIVGTDLASLRLPAK
jgi:hypothetical protein